MTTPIVEQNKIFEQTARRYPLPLIPTLNQQDIEVLVGIYVTILNVLTEGIDAKLPSEEVHVLAECYANNEEAYLKAMEIILILAYNQGKLGDKHLINYPEFEEDLKSDYGVVIDKTSIMQERTKLNHLTFDLKGRVRSGLTDDLIPLLSKFIHCHNLIRSTIYPSVPDEHKGNFKPTTTHMFGHVLTELNWINNPKKNVYDIENEELDTYHKDCITALQEGFKTNADEDGYVTIEAFEDDEAIAESLLTIVDADVRAQKCLEEDDTTGYDYASMEHATQLMFLLATVNKEVGSEIYDISPLPLIPNKNIIDGSCIKIHDIVAYPEDNSDAIGETVEGILKEFSTWAAQMSSDSKPNFYLLKDRLSALIMLYAASRDEEGDEDDKEEK